MKIEIKTYPPRGPRILVKEIRHKNTLAKIMCGPGASGHGVALTVFNQQGDPVPDPALWSRNDNQTVQELCRMAEKWITEKIVNDWLATERANAADKCLGTALHNLIRFSWKDALHDFGEGGYQQEEHLFRDLVELNNWLLGTHHDPEDFLVPGLI